jgi:hypothetical protein
MRKFKPYQLLVLLICLFAANFTASADETNTYFLTLRPYQEASFVPSTTNYSRVEWYVSTPKDYDCNVIGEYAEVTSVYGDSFTAYFNTCGLYLVTYLYLDSNENLIQTDVYDILCKW